MAIRLRVNGTSNQSALAVRCASVFCWLACSAGCGAVNHTDANPETGGSTSARGGSVGSSGAPTTGGRSSSGGASNGGSSVACTGPARAFPEFDRSCGTASDCVLVAHTTSCCGAELVQALAASAKPDFEAAEAICDAQYPACGCAAQWVDIEDGTQVSFPWEPMVKAVCEASACKARSRGSAFPCGVHTCTEQQYCIESSGGPAGTEPSANCADTACTDCACLTLDAACSCSASDGHLFVSCQQA